LLDINEKIANFEKADMSTLKGDSRKVNPKIKVIFIKQLPITFPRAKNETRRLFQQKDKLKNEVEALQNRKASLKLELEGLKIDKKKLEDIILMDRFLLEQTLSQALINLKAKRPDLFSLTKADQIGLLLKAILW
jgi:hypothetical protein